MAPPRMLIAFLENNLNYDGEKYTISIHKAQGLEYDSVKIIITSNVEDNITKNIFYTAITRTKKHLKIFWSSESQVKIFDQMKKRNNSRDISILKQKLNI